jgi:cysteine desulfurase/selenocysteine lyase
MIRSVSFEDAEWNDLPWKFEAGTPVIAQGIALAEAADYLEDIGMERVRRHEEAMAAEAYRRLDEIDAVTVLGPEPGDDARAGLVSFVVDGLHAHDLASIMNDHAVAVRAGDHCTQPLHDKLGVPASTRASFYVYNSVEEIDPLVAGVEDAVELFS